MVSYLVFFENADGKLKINNKETEVEKYSVVNLPILSTLQLNNINSNSKGWCIKFNKEARDILLIHSFQLFCPFTGVIKTTTDKQIFKKIDFYLQEIKTEITNNNKSANEIIYLQTALIIKYLSRNINSTSQITDNTVKKFADLVNLEFKNNHGIEFYSNKIGVSTKTLSRLTRKTINITPKQIIQYRINAEAIRLLIHSQQSIKEIAYELNFNSPDYFNHFFKKINKTSPSTYKNQMSQNISF